MVNPLATGIISVCGWIFQTAEEITMHVLTRKHLSNSDAFALEILEMFPRY